MASRSGFTRRDFLNGMLLAAGGAAVSNFIPMRAYAGNADVCDGGIGVDPRVLRGGNVPGVFNIAHWMRDRRLTFNGNQVTLAASNCDAQSGTFQIHDDAGKYDVVIVGSGLSGLSAAFYITNRRPGTKILIVDGNAFLGGNAGRDDESPIANIASTAGAYAVTPYADFQTEIYGKTGINPDAHLIDSPFYNYFFDDRTPYAIKGARGWNIDTYGAGTDTMPYPPEILKDIQSAKQDFINWLNTTGSPTDPADNGDPQFDYLSVMTLENYLTNVKGYHPAVADFYTRYTIDALSGTASQVNAYSAISFIGAEYGSLFAFPGGTAGIARYIARWLVPSAFPKQDDKLIDKENDRFEADDLDDPNNAVRIRQGAMALYGDQDKNSASVVYYKNGKFYRATAKTAIFAGQGHTAATCLFHLNPGQFSTFFRGFTLAPVVVANVTLKRAKPIVDLGLGYDEYYWGSKYWADFVVADWMDKKRRGNPHRPVTLTFYGGNTFPANEMHNERLKLLNTPFSSYEDSLREDMNRVFAGAHGGFDFDDDVSSVFLYRWGHSMVFPTPGFPFGPVQGNGMIDRSKAARRVFRQQLGRISIAGQDTESTPAVESALGSGLRTALEVLPLL